MPITLGDKPSQQAQFVSQTAPHKYISSHIHIHMWVCVCVCGREQINEKRDLKIGFQFLSESAIFLLQLLKSSLATVTIVRKTNYNHQIYRYGIIIIYSTSQPNQVLFLKNIIYYIIYGMKYIYNYPSALPTLQCSLNCVDSLFTFLAPMLQIYMYGEVIFNQKERIFPAGTVNS